MIEGSGDINITADFETFYSAEYTLTRLTTVEYIRDARFKAFMCGVQVNDGAPQLLSGMDQMSSFFAAVPWERVNLIGHNLRFDGAVLAWIFGHRPKQYRDTLSMSRAVIGAVLAKHSLDSVSNHLGFGSKHGYNSGEAQALAAVKGVYSPTPSQMQALGHYCAHAPNSDIALTYKVYNALAPCMPDPEWALIDWTLRMFVDPVLELNTEKLEMYEREVREEKAALVAETGWPKGNFTSNDKFAAMLKMHDVDPPKKWSPTTGKSTYAFAKSDLDFVLLGEEHPNEVVRDLVNCRLAVKSSIEETRAKTLWRISQTGNMPVPINYSGALNTHRLSGGDGYNVQNFKRGGTLRKSIKAPKGKVLLVADLSGIELRVGTALVGDTARTEMLRRGEDLYCDTATSLFGALVVPDGASGYTKDPMKERRLVGKVAELSLGYQSGGFTFRGMLRQMGGLRWSDARCGSVVETWRAHHPDHVNAWKNLQTAVQQMCAGEAPGDWHIPTAGDNPVFWFEKDAIILPRGLRIKYPNIRYEWFEETVGEKTTRRRHMVYDDARAKNGMAKLYGGKVLENLCQALATCIYLEQVAVINKIWPVVMSVHDEVILCGTYEEMKRIMPYVRLVMRQPPVWWPDLPLDVEGDIAHVYGEAK